MRSRKALLALTCAATVDATCCIENARASRIESPV